MVLGGAVNFLNNLYLRASDALPPEYILVMTVFVYSIILVGYSFFTYFFYRNLSKRDILSLNLSKYNSSKHPGLAKFFAFALYIAEYLLILPIFVFIWFSVLSIVIVVLSPGQTIQQSMMIAVAIVTATRILSYYTEDLAADIAKLLPLTIIAVSFISPSSFSISTIIDSISQLSALTSNIFFFLVFIVGIELVLRILQVVQDSLFD